MAGNRTKGKGKTSEMLARRRAALERAAERMAAQRRAAEEAEAERQRQEAAFDELVADFELAVEEETLVAAELEEELRRVRERGQVRIDAAKVAAARVVLAMGKAGETVAGCGRRLGVGVERVKELRRLGREDSAEEDSEATPEKVEADSPGTASVAEKESGPDKARPDGPDGEQRRAPGQAGAVARGGGTGPVAAPPVSAPAVPPAPPTAPPTPPIGPSEVPGGAGGARPGWPEPSR
ncbi:hypothetical protein ACPXCO_37255 [Streptomyces cyaneofuscatus]|uniref:hypothetical protein n=1 Tax=Streptomyces cyaneofuscatus TaxID=66883 RepID=UPI003CF23BD4